MKTISIRFNDHLANWIMGNCQKNKITISEFIRDLLYSKMQHGQIDHKLKINKQKYMQPQNNRTEMGYIIFAAKLIEGLVLATQEQGVELRNAAFQESKDLLSQLNLNHNKNKEQQLCIVLEQELYSWLQSEAVRLQSKIIPLIRNIIEEATLKDQNNSTQPVMKIQKAAIEHQFIACKLLEILISKTVNDGATLIEDAKSKAKEVVLKLKECL
jgi:hypothetical protein